MRYEALTADEAVAYAQFIVKNNIPVKDWEHTLDQINHGISMYDVRLGTNNSSLKDEIRRRSRGF